jgi:stage V sporulation protein G
LNITEVRVKLMRNRSDRLRAFCSITVDDDFVVHDLRVIDGRKGLFVAMPSRKLTDNCPQCNAKNELKARFCSYCGKRLAEGRSQAALETRDKLHVDVAHPINTPCRELLQRTVLDAYRAEEERQQQGLPPAHDYDVSGLDELADEYGYEEEVHGEASPTVVEAPEPVSGPTEDLPADSGGEEAPAGEDRPAEDSSEREVDGGFGAGIF